MPELVYTLDSIRKTCERRFPDEYLHTKPFNQWCEENIGKQISFRHADDEHGDRVVIMQFETEEDALIFKLKW